MNGKKRWFRAWVTFASILLLAAVLGADAHAQSNRAVRPGFRSGLIQSGNHVFYPGDTLQIRVVFPRSLRAVWAGEADSYLLLRMPDGQLVLPPILLYAAAIADPPITDPPAADPPTTDPPATDPPVTDPPTTDPPATDPPVTDPVRPVPLFTDIIPDSPRNLVTIDLSYDSLPAGVYQMALILTRPGGDPTVLSDWYNGFEGLVSVSRIIFANERGAVPEDQDGDGTVEGDADSDGWTDEDDSTTADPDTSAEPE